MKNLKIYYIDESYINYLRQFDKNVAYNKNTTRPYIGIVYTYNNFNYFAPLDSPKPKHININPKAIDIYKIKDGELGVVNINNMIPTPIEELTEVLPTIKDKYWSEKPNWNSIPRKFNYCGIDPPELVNAEPFYKTVWIIKKI